VRTLTLRCGHGQESRARAGSTLACRTCGQRGKVTRAMVASAEGKPVAAGPARPRLVPRPAAASGPVWDPPPVPRVVPCADPGTCGCGTVREWGPAGHATVARCPRCGTWALHPAAAGHGQQLAARGGKQAADEFLYLRAETLTRHIREELAGGELEDDDAGRLRLALDNILRARRDRSSSRLASSEAYLRGLGWLDEAGLWLGDVGEDEEPGGIAGAEDGTADGEKPTGRVIDGTGLVLSRSDSTAVLSVSQQIRAGTGLAAAAWCGEIAEAELLEGVRRQAMILLGQVTGRPPTYEQLTGIGFVPPARAVGPSGLPGQPRGITSGADPAAAFWARRDTAATAMAREAGAIVERASAAAAAAQRQEKLAGPAALLERLLSR
jgi:hypothetical protein